MYWKMKNRTCSNMYVASQLFHLEFSSGSSHFATHDRGWLVGLSAGLQKKNPKNISTKLPTPQLTFSEKPDKSPFIFFDFL